MKKLLLAFLLIITTFTLCAQELRYKQPQWLAPQDSLNKKRLYWLIGGSTVAYSGALLGLNYLWYADFERTSFHFFNDAKEWQGIDKMGHVYTTYFESVWAFHALRWSGVSNKKAAWAAAGTAWGLQATIEVLDGFSEKWGASGYDLIANSVGTALFLPQQLLWNEQRIQMKVSYHSVEHSDAQLKARATDLYGSNSLERIFKDYNSSVYWLSFNLSSFFPKQKRGKWVNISLGYGAGGMYGGFDNSWYDDEGNFIDRTDVERYRRFFISMDADLTKIKTKTYYGSLILGMLNILKFPFPALEVNTKGEILFHPVFMLDWSIPLHIKR